MESRNCFRRVTVEAFRAFRDRQEFDLDASVVIVSGANGTGKTSFFDALQWLLCGRIKRLEDIRARRTVEHIVNQYRRGERAVVEAELVVDGRAIALRRTGDRRGSSLEVLEQDGQAVFGEDAEERLRDRLLPDSDLSLEMSLNTSGLLQQDVMREVLEAKPGVRYEHLSSILGLGQLEDFEDAARAAAKAAQEQHEAAIQDRDLAARSLAARRERLVEFQDLQRVRPSVESVLGTLRTIIAEADDLVTVEVAAATPEEAQAVASEASIVAEELRSISADLDSIASRTTELAPEPSDAQLSDASQALQDASAALTAATNRLQAAQQELAAAELTSETMERLAAAALPMLGSICPVCGNEIDPEQVASELRARAGNTTELLSARSAVADAQKNVSDQEQAASRARLALSELEQRRSTWATIKRDRDAAARRLLALSAADRLVRLTFSDVEEVSDRSERTLAFLRQLRGILGHLSETLASDSASTSISRTHAEIRGTEEMLRAREQRVAQLAARALDFEALSAVAVDARIEVTERRFKALQPLVDDIYGRLDPHPAFKTIEFETDTYYRRGATTPLVRDPVANVAADPLIVFSTSQANIAALAYFLAMGSSARVRSVPFLLLDDPLQSMDDINVLGFADLCRHLRASRQLMISTHESRFANLLERKLAPRDESLRTVALDFEAWDRSGPTIGRRLVEPQVLDPPIRLVQAAS
jgi:DNA repair exonuclease SbcCD ATPase subunit